MNDMIKIGPHCSFELPYIPNIQDAIQADNERGSHHLNNAAAEQLNKEWPTLLAMAYLIEAQRDQLIDLVKRLSELKAYRGDRLPITNFELNSLFEEADIVLKGVSKP